MRDERQRAQVVDAGRLVAAVLGVLRLVAPGDERGEAAGLVLQIAQPHHVLDALLVRLHRPVHHRRRRAQAGTMRLAHDAEPLVGRRLAVAVQQLADAVDEDLGAAAGNAVEAGRDEPFDDCRRRQPIEPRDVQDLRRRQRVQLEVRISRLHRAEQILVPLERQIGIVTALQQQLVAADARSSRRSCGRSPRSRARSRRCRPLAVERAEVAARDADVRVVDVAVDDVGDDALRMLARADGVGQATEQVRRRVAIELQRFRRIDAAAVASPSVRSDQS